MMKLQSADHCPTCGSDFVRASSRRRLEPLLLLLMRRPYRCDECDRRFWGPPTTHERKFLFWAVTAIVCAGICWMIMEFSL
jgi:hypothetical protein